MVRRYVIGTAGHVDHGKTSLVRALTGTDTDRLPEEKRRGITIELGFARWDLGDGIVASIVDVPGHRRLVHAMIAGASGMEGVLLVVAADEGAMPQTREHVRVCELLGIPRAVIVVTKCDLVDDDLADVAGEEVRALASRSMAVTDVVLCSSKTVVGLDRVRAASRRMLGEQRAPRGRDRARLSVDRVFTVKGAGTVVTGTLVEGRMSIGDALRVVGSHETRESTARGLRIHEDVVDVVEAPARLAINLAGVALSDVHRGDVVTSDARIGSSTRVDVLLRGEHALARSVAATMHVGTARTAARVVLVNETRTGAVARLRLGEPIAIFGGDRFVVRGSNIDGKAGAIVGGGVVLDAHAPSRRARDARRTLLDALASGSAIDAIHALVVEAEPRALARAGMATRFAIGIELLDAAADALVQDRELVKIGDYGWMRRSTLAALTERAMTLVLAHANSAPLDRGMPVQTLRERLAAIAGAEAAAEALRAAVASGLSIAGDVASVRAAEHVVDSALRARLEAAFHAIARADTHGVTEFAVRDATGASVSDTRAILAKLVRDERIVHVGDLWIARDVVERARAHALAHFTSSERLTVIGFKALTGLPRKQAILLLEHFDRQGFTRRDGDARVRLA